jgi:hypothetical protein
MMILMMMMMMMMMMAMMIIMMVRVMVIKMVILMQTAVVMVMRVVMSMSILQNDHATNPMQMPGSPVPMQLLGAPRRSTHIGRSTRLNFRIHTIQGQEGTQTQDRVPDLISGYSVYRAKKRHERRTEHQT